MAKGSVGVATKKRVHVYYSGRVQGVGFRLTAEEVAEAMRIVGWVKNLNDGRVELVAEAKESKLLSFLEQVRTGPMKNFISDEDIKWSPAQDCFQDFDIRYY